jgi:hypothetical protein
VLFSELAQFRYVDRLRIGLLFALCSLVNPSCTDGGFYFSVSAQPSDGQTVAINGEQSFQSYLWWQHFATYEDGLNAAQLPVELFSNGVPILIDTIGPGYCAALCTADFCRAGLIAEETVRLTIDSTIRIAGACTDFDGNVVTIAK